MGKGGSSARDVVELGRKGVYELHTVSAHSTGTIDNPATIAPPTHAVYSHADFPAGWRNIDPLQSYETLFNGVIFPSENQRDDFYNRTEQRRYQYDDSTSDANSIRRL